MSQRFWTLIFAFISFTTLSAQTGWERIFPVDMSIEHLTVDGTHFEDGYLKLTLTTERDSGIYKNANITKHDIKGDILWSRNLIVEDSLELMREGDLMVLHDGNIAVNLVGMKDSLNHFVIMTDNTGQLLWSKRYAMYQDSTDFDLVRPRLVQSKADTTKIFMAGIGLNEGKMQMFVSSIDVADGNVAWSNYIDSESSELRFGAIEACAQGGAIISGIDQTSQQFVVSKVTESGALVFNRTLTTTIMPTPTESSANSIVQLRDSSYVLVGNYRTQNVEDDGFIIKMDTFANIDWAKRVDFDFSFNDVDLLDVIESSDDRILISAKQVGFLDTAAFGLKLDLDGNVLWQSKFRETDVEDIHLGGLGLANNGGMSYFLTGGNEEEQYIAYMITTDSMGRTMCNDTIDMNIVFDVDFSSDTLELVSSPYLPTYTEFCCDDSFFIGDDMNNTPNRIKIIDDHTYIASENFSAPSQFANFTKIDDNNEVVWTYQLDFESTIFDFEKINDDEFMLIGWTEPSTGNDDNSSFIIKIDDDGNYIDGGIVNNTGTERMINIFRHSNPINPLFPIYITGTENYTNNLMSIADESFIMNIDEDYNINWFNSYDVDSANTELRYATQLDNGNILAYGSGGPNAHALIAEIDGLNGSIVKSKQSTGSNYFFEAEVLNNGNILVAGGNLPSGWNAHVSILDPDFNFINGLSYDASEANLFSELELATESLFYTTGLHSDGSPLLNSFIVTNDSLLVPVNSHRVKLPLNNTSYPFFDIVSDQLAYTAGWDVGNGNRDLMIYNGPLAESLTCFEELSLSPIANQIIMDTLEINVLTNALDTFASANVMALDWEQQEFCTVVEFAECSDAAVESTGFGDYSVPVLMLNVRPFCPNEPLIWTFDAETPGAIGYLWMNDDGDNLGTADTLTVTETGMYNVIVTMGSDVCYTLCDTATLEVFEEPEVSISESSQILCETGQIILTAIPNAEAGLDTIIWSTGESTQSINVGSPGTYSVTIVDDCGIEATASIQPNFDVLTPPVANIEAECANGMILLTAVLIDGTTDPPLMATAFNWSTGENTGTISVQDDQATYSVTITDQCGLQAETSIVPVQPNPEANILQEDLTCTDGTFRLQGELVGGGDIFGISWSTGESTNPITITQPGFYTVTVTDVCGKQAETTEEVIFPVLVESIALSSACSPNGGYDLTVAVNPANATNVEINWVNATGSGSTINVPNGGMYSVDVIDECGNVFTEIVQTAPLIDDLGGIVINSACAQGNINLTVNPADTLAVFPTNYTFEWSPGGETTQTISVPVEDQTYTVTVMDGCGNPETLSFDVLEDICGGIDWPNVFTPNENAMQLEVNRDYGPVYRGGDWEEVISNYTLEIYNRWGERVFFTDEFDEHWDGTYKEKDQPNDVYLWIAKYEFLGNSRTDKGDLTLLR